MDSLDRDEPRAWNDSHVRPAEAPVVPAMATPAATKAVAGAPSLGQRWRKAQPTKATLVWACLASVVVTMMVGFLWGGWVTGGSAERTALNTANAAVVARLAPICLAQYQQDPERGVKRAEFDALSASKSVQYVQDQGWATIADVEKPDRKVADACSKLILASTP